MLGVRREACKSIRMADTPAQKVGRNVRAEMARNGITQDVLAARLNLTQPAVSRRLSGSVPFNVDELAVVTRMVGLSLSRLVAGAERPSHRTESEPVTDAGVAA